MNNSEFRSLLERDKNVGARSETKASSPVTLGARARNSIPMTPRSVVGRKSNAHFARQVFEHTRENTGEPPTKKFKSKTAPRGTKLAQGYSDRTTSRRDDEEEQSDKVKKLRELEEMVKQEKIDRATYDKLRDQMGIGGDLSTTHLVKGLDFKLLEKSRRGDDLNATDQAGLDTSSADVEDELDNVLQQEVAEKKRTKSTGADEDTSAEQLPAMTRDEILQRLKAGRSAAPVHPPEAALGDRFKKLAPVEKAGKKKFVETVNGRRREVLVITKDDGSIKRKTRWLDPEQIAEKTSKAWGMEVPAELAAKQKALAELEAAEEEDDDIFQGVGADYDPLAGIESDEDEPAQKRIDGDVAKSESGKPRNYFRATDVQESEDRHTGIKQDPTLLAAFKRAAAIRSTEQAEDDAAKADETDRSRQFLNKLKEQERQDARDMDLGFGDSRYGDDDDEDGPVVGNEDDTGKQKRKRAPKKRKGDKDNVADVMSVLEGRKK